jgi:predicted nucleic-acid-binding Zn-ribbon protein
MRSTQMCPKCAGKRFAVFAQLRVPHRQEVLPAMTFEDGSATGTFETWACLDCGYTEFYTLHIHLLEMRARTYPEQVRIVDARPPEQGPYR